VQESASERTETESTGPANKGAFSLHVGHMTSAFLGSPVRNTVVLLGLAILGVILATAYGQIILNRWNAPFYDAMERRDLAAFLHQLWLFIWIAGALLILNVIQTYLNQKIRLKLREGLTRDLLGEWMRPGRAFRLSTAGEIGVNPDQRMHEDTRHLVDLTTDLGIGLLQATILLVSFVGVLWSLSSDFTLTLFGYRLEIPGYMVWAAFIYAGTASWVSWLVGRRLIKLNSQRYAREAELRFSFMHANENLDAISLAAAETDERRRIEIDLSSVLDASARIMRAVTNLTWVTAGYGWMTVVAPFIIAAPAYFSGDLTFGGLMMAVGAFNQVHESLRWFVNNIGGIADFRATLTRVAEFRDAVKATDILQEVDKRIEIVEGEPGKMAFSEMVVHGPSGTTRLVDAHAEIISGERVLINSAPGTGRALFFRAIAGLWPWGSGRISLPKGEAPYFIPKTPYFPPGTLRHILTSPLPPEAHPDAELVALLVRLDLGRIAGSLDRTARWDRELNDDEQRALAFARLAIQKPRWVVISEALELFEGETRKRIFALLSNEMGQSTIISIGKPGRDGGFFSRTLHLASDPDGHAIRALRPAHPATKKDSGQAESAA
jgi:vitamin B12/bleomycin/antimicrobial peptide transport system ATP-binding/permease protein